MADITNGARKTREEIVAENHTKNSQDVISFGRALNKVLRARTIGGAHRAAKRALKRAEYYE